MTLKQLEAFYWAANTSNFLLASQRLHVTQSTLSKRIAELEAHLGKPLFDRSGYRAVLTESGELLLPLARRMLGLSDDIRLMVMQRQGLRGYCRFGVGELAALTWLPALVAHLQTLHPELVLEPYVDVGAALERRIEAGELDFAIVAGYSPRSAIASEGIAKVRYSWVAAAGLVGRQRSINAKLLQHNALITMPAAAGPTRMLEQWLARNNFEGGRRLICNNLAATTSLIAAGVGLGLCPMIWLERLARRDVVALHSRPVLPLLEYSFQYRRDDSRALIVKAREAVLATVDFEQSDAFW